MKNPSLLKITFHTFRHWKATMLYHQTRGIPRSQGYLVDGGLLKRAIRYPHRTVWNEEERSRTIREAFLEMLRKELMKP